MRSGGSTRILKRVIAAVVVSGAAAVAGGCATAERGGPVESVSDCRHLTVAAAPAPASTEPSGTEPVTVLSTSPFRVFNAKLDTSQLLREAKLEDRPSDDPSLDPADPRIQRYFEAIKRRIEARWVYPEESLTLKQAGSGMARFRLARDGSLSDVEIRHS